LKRGGLSSPQVQSDTAIDLEAKEYETYHKPFPPPSPITSAVYSSHSSPTIQSPIQISNENSEAFRPLTTSALREHYPALLPEFEESSRPGSVRTIIGEFPTEPPLQSPVLLNTSTQATAAQCPAPSLTAKAETSDTELETPEPTLREPTVTLAGRTIKPPNHYRLTAEYALLIRAAQENPDEPTLQDAMHNHEKGEWDKALQKEVEGIESYATWEEATPPNGARFIGIKWVLRKNRDESGMLLKYKARLTAKGYAQIPGLDFDETFSVVIRTDTILLLLAHCVQF